MATDKDEDTRSTRGKLANIYDFYRVSILNEKYYGEKLHKLVIISKALDITLAIGATGSGVAGWQLWNTPSGKYIWVCIAGAASVISLVKPVLEIDKKIDTYTKLYYGHHVNSVRMARIVERIRAEMSLSAATDQEYEEIHRAFSDLAAFDDYRPSEKLLLRLMEKVNTEVPADSFWMPPAGEVQ